MKLVSFEKSTIAAMVFMASLSGAKAASTDTAFINTSPNTNIVIGIQGQDESVKIYNLDQIDNNTSSINTETAHRVAADMALEGQVTTLENGKADKMDVANLQGEVTSNKTDQDSVNHALLNQNIAQDKLIDGNKTRIQALENQPKPTNGKDGAKGDKGDRGERGLAGVNTTITKVDSATQAKVASNSKAITETAKQSANVAKDLQDAKQFISQQQTSNNAQFKSLKDEMDDNKKESRSGAASAIAIASMPQVEAGQSVMFSAGAGTFKDEQALSVGASFHAGTSTVIKAGVSDSTNNDFAMGAGIGIGF